jgi:predicted secreted hydrolase
MTPRTPAWRRLPAIALVALVVTGLVAGCSPGGRILANDPPPRPSVAPRTPRAVAARDPQPVVLPRDDAPHRRLTEWWYYTGHLRTDDARRYGFEFVIFRVERGDFPVTWASHLALTDETGGTFAFEERSEIGPQVDREADVPDEARTRFDLAISGGGAFLDPAGGASSPSPRPTPVASARPADPWRMTGSGGRDRLDAAAAGFALELDLDGSARPAALHDHDGYIDFGPGGGSYYYSRTRMDATGSLTVGGRRASVEGQAWFDHQWGDFIQVGGGGWDWFAVNLADGTDVTLSLVRDAAGGYPLVYGTLVGPDGVTRHLPREQFTVNVTRQWTSPATGATYPAGWHISLPGERLEIDLVPTVDAQELDTRASTGVVYWEGSQRVTATRDGAPLAGEAYVELTGYGPGIASTGR